MSMHHTVTNQILVGAPFAIITASMQCGMEVISLLLCSGLIEAQVALVMAFSLSTSLPSSSRQYSIDMEFRSGQFTGQSNTETPCSLKHILVILAGLSFSSTIFSST
ncbi:hypothetical protein AMECASPLE_029144 [Ameca splendens]|uniref:Uncharacterized protein n=1 Tax=Ameca splendens TaxID=208324 RepID=A0ABV0YHE1_9TELE